MKSLDGSATPLFQRPLLPMEGFCQVISEIS